MAHFAKLVTLIFLLSFFSSQIHARESHFFSKVSHDNNVQETKNTIKNPQLPTKEDPMNKQKPETEPKQTFTKDNQNSYGLYGKETSQTTNYAPYITTADGGRVYDLNKDPLLKNQENVDDTEFQEHRETLLKNQQLLDDTKFQENHGTLLKNQEFLDDTKFQENHDSYTPRGNQKNNYYSSYSTKAYDENYNGQNKYGRNDYNNYEEQPKFYYNGDNVHYNQQQQTQGFKDTTLADNGYNTLANQESYRYNGNVQKQGLSDTRFLENGRYFYDVNKDMYNPNQFDNYGEMSSRNEFDKRNYYGNNEYNNKNFIGGYQNQKEFEGNDDQFVP